MQIKSVKIDEERVKVVYRNITDDDENSTRVEVTLDSSDSPKPGFTKAWNALAAQMNTALGLPAGFVKSDDVRSVTIKDPEEGTFVISASVALGDYSRPFNVTTPLMDKEHFGKLHSAVRAVERAAEEYVRGERRQLVLDIAA